MKCNVLPIGGWWLASACWISCCAGESVALAQFDLEKMRALNPRMQLPLTIDDSLVEGQSIRVIRGEHLVLYTDVRDRQDVESLVRVFDLAVPQWCELFRVDHRKTKPWQLVAFLIQDRDRFEQAGLWPPDLPEFPAGYNQGHHFWFFPQEGDYYTRHLMLHEGTHAFMQWFLGGSGPPWYSEGMAEWTALHRWDGEAVQLRCRIRDRDEVEYWGRPKLIRKAIAEGRRPRLDELFDLPNNAYRDVENYGWAWAACEFLSRNPLTLQEFERLTKSSDDVSSRFSQQFKNKLRSVWDKVEFDWQQFVDEIDYGVLADRLSVRSAATEAVEEGHRVVISTEWGWQDTAVPVQAGDTLTFSATGRFQVKGEPSPWPCGADGITIDYYRGQPLGILIAAVMPQDLMPSVILQPIPIGSQRQVTFEQSGTLLLRINESPAWMDDNAGSLTVDIQRTSK